MTKTESSFEVSLIIVNYNGFEITKNCLDSLFAKSQGVNFEVIVLDNNSQDNSLEKLKQAFREKGNLKVIGREKNDFLTAAYNEGFRYARGKILVFMNNDLIFGENWLKELLDAFNQENVGIAGAAMLSRENPDLIDNLGCRLNILGYGERIAANKRFKQEKEFPEAFFVPGSLIAIKKELFEKIGGFDESYGGNYEDLDLAWQVRLLGYRIVIAKKVIVYHLGSWTVEKYVGGTKASYLCRKNRLATLLKNAGSAYLVIIIFPYLFLQLLVFLKEIIFDKNIGLALTTPRAIFWNLVNIKNTLAKRKKIQDSRQVSEWQIIKEIAPVKILEEQKNITQTNFNRGHRYLIDRIRFTELKKEIGRNNFRLLDLGCGEATFVEVARAAGAFAIGVDQSPPPPRPELIASSIENFSTTQDFDAVTLFHVLEHTENPLKVLKIATAFLKKDGVLVLEIPLVGNLTEKFLGKDYFVYQDPGHRHFFTKKEIAALLESAGLRIEKKGLTLLIFPITLLTTAFKQGIIKGLLAVLIFLPLKFLIILGFNEEIIRLYCKKHGQ